MSEMVGNCRFFRNEHGEFIAEWREAGNGIHCYQWVMSSEGVWCRIGPGVSSPHCYQQMKRAFAAWLLEEIAR